MEKTELMKMLENLCDALHWAEPDDKRVIRMDIADIRCRLEK